jgi:sulfite reductase (NADPH) flavoprotein alpha-component
VLSATGLAIGYERMATSLFYKLTGSQPSSRPRTRLTPPAGAAPISLDSAFAIARAALPGALPFQVNVPDPGDPIVVRSHFPEDLTPGGRSIVIIDPYTSKVLFAEGSRTAPAGARMVIANRALHTGDIAGIPGKALMSLASVMAVMQVWSGVVMWWKRKERNA